MISVSTSAEHTVSTVSSVRHNGFRLDQNTLFGAEIPPPPSLHDTGTP